MKLIDLVQRSPEWHNWRKSRICASDSPTILGLNPYATRYELWLEKLGMGKQKEINEAMQRGIDLEDEAREMLNKKTGWQFKPACVENIQDPLFAASLDGYYFCDHTDEKYICEIKCSGERIHNNVKHGGISEIYYVQVQHQLLITNADCCLFCNYHDNDLAIVEIHSDKSIQSRIIDEGKKFWDLVKNFEAPELTSKDYIERSDQAYEQFTYDWKSFQEDKKNLQEREESLRERGIKLSQGQNIRGFGVSIQHAIRKGPVDYSKVQILKTINLEEYRKAAIKITTIRGES